MPERFEVPLKFCLDAMRHKQSIQVSFRKARSKGKENKNKYRKRHDHKERNCARNHEGSSQRNNSSVKASGKPKEEGPPLAQVIENVSDAERT